MNKDVCAATVEDKKTTESLITQDIEGNKTDNPMDKTFIHCKDKNLTGICERKGCKNSFIKKVSWKRFCSKDCQISAWERKNNNG